MIRFIIFLCLASNALWAKESLLFDNSSLDEKVKEDIDSFYNPKVDYSLFNGRVTDRDKSASILKIFSENKNAKFFKAGDKVQFQVHRAGTDWCQGYVRKVEKEYFVLYVKDLNTCWHDRYLRRGSRLNFKSPVLAQRVKEASYYRVLLIKRKQDYFRQLNGINHFVWNYDQKKIQLAAAFDQKILDIQKEKTKALDELLAKKKDQIFLQRELIFRLSNLDEDLNYYRVRNDDTTLDRWQHDHNFALPVGYEPQ